MHLQALHSAVDALRRKEEDIVHSVDEQITYLKAFDGTVKFNFSAIQNLSDTLKDIALKAQEGFRGVAHKLAWSNKQREAATAMRQVEFALLRMETSIEELIVAMQFVVLGKIPLNLVRPNMLREMLKNVTMVLPEGYDLLACLNSNNMFMYYEMVQAVVLADLHSFKLVFYVPLKTVKRYFELYKIIAFPTRILNNTC